MSANILTIKQIEDILPQRYPFLLIDKVLDYKENDYLVAVKNVTGNEWALGEGKGAEHFPEMLLVEAALQAAIILYHLSKNSADEYPSYFIGKIETKFYNLSQIGDMLILSVLAEKLMREGGYASIVVKSKENKLIELRIFFSVKR